MAPCTIKSPFFLLNINLHGAPKLLADNSSNNSSMEAQNTVDRTSASSSPENGPINPNDPNIDRTKYIANTLGHDREAIESYFNQKRSAVCSAHDSSTDSCKDIL